MAHFMTVLFHDSALVLTTGRPKCHNAVALFFLRQDDALLVRHLIPTMINDTPLHLLNGQGRSRDTMLRGGSIWRRANKHYMLLINGKGKKESLKEYFSRQPFLRFLLWNACGMQNLHISRHPVGKKNLKLQLKWSVGWCFLLYYMVQ